MRATPRSVHLLGSSSVRSWKVVMKLRPVRCFMRYTGHSNVPDFFTSLACKQAYSQQLTSRALDGLKQGACAAMPAGQAHSLAAQLHTKGFGGSGHADSACTLPALNDMGLTSTPVT